MLIKELVEQPRHVVVCLELVKGNDLVTNIGIRDHKMHSLLCTLSSIEQATRSYNCPIAIIQPVKLCDQYVGAPITKLNTCARVPHADFLTIDRECAVFG